jgi:hypothetical protein
VRSPSRAAISRDRSLQHRQRLSLIEFDFINLGGDDENRCDPTVTAAISNDDDLIDRMTTHAEFNTKYKLTKWQRLEPPFTRKTSLLKILLPSQISWPIGTN